MSILRSPEFRFIAFAVLLSGAGWALADGVDAQAERARIARERTQVEQRYGREVQACNEQFVVTACVEDAKARRRDDLERLAREEGVLDDAARRERGAERLKRLDEKQRDAAEHPALLASAPPRVVERAAPASVPAPALRTPSRVPHPATPSQPTAAERRQNLADYQRRQDAAQAHREAVERRLKEREAKKAKAASEASSAAAAAASAAAR
jgi:hypothetical protein